MSNRDDLDPSALGGSDAEILSLFRQWIAACRAHDHEEEREDGESPALDRRDEIEDQILAIPGGAAALAIKTFLYLRADFSTWSPELGTFRLPELFNGEACDWVLILAASLVRDAATIVPEVAELAAPIVHEDANLIDADMGISWCREMLADSTTPKPRRREILGKMATLFTRIATTEAKTDRGHAIKTAASKADERISA